MKHVYEENPKLGDSQTIVTQLDENASDLEKLQADLQKYQTMLNEVISGTPASQKKKSSISSGSNLSVQSGGGGGGMFHRNSISEDSLSRSESDTSVNNNNNGYNGHHDHNTSTTGSNGTNGSHDTTPTGNGHLSTSSNGGSNSSLVLGVTSLFNKLTGSTLGSATNQTTASSPHSDHVTPLNGQSSPFKVNGGGANPCLVVNGKEENDS